MNKIIYGLIALFVASACQKIILEEDQATGDKAENFDYLWQQCRDRYAFFDVKNVDWDEVYAEYRPQVRSDMGEVEFFDLCFDMLLELRDGHVNLISPFNVAKYEFELTGAENYNRRLIRDNYLSDKHMITGPFLHDTLANQQVGYVRYASFSNNIAAFDIDFVLQRFKNTKGIILDVRSNPGGSIGNMFTLLSRFADEKREIYSSQIKSGPGPNQFSEVQTAYATPGGSFQYTDGKVVLLVNRGCYSATSFFTVGMRALPQVLVMGDTTGGGLGAPNGGQLPNGWLYRLSVTRTITPEGDNFENGVPPDVYVALDSVDIVNGRDTMIEAAVDYILD